MQSQKSKDKKSDNHCYPESWSCNSDTLKNRKLKQKEKEQQKFMVQIIYSYLYIIQEFRKFNQSSELDKKMRMPNKFTVQNNFLASNLVRRSQ